MQNDEEPENKFQTLRHFSLVKDVSLPGRMPPAPAPHCSGPDPAGYNRGDDIGNEIDRPEEHLKTPELADQDGDREAQDDGNCDKDGQPFQVMNQAQLDGRITEDLLKVIQADVLGISKSVPVVQGHDQRAQRRACHQACMNDKGRQNE